MEKDYSKDIESAANVRRTARITGLTKRYIKMVIAGKRTNQIALDIYMLLQEGNEEKEKEATALFRSLRKHATV